MSERRELPYSWTDLRARLQRDIDTVLLKLFPSERVPSGTAAFTPLNPRRNDRHAGSFVIWRDGDRQGAWRDFAVAGAQGDVFQLIGYVLGLVGPMDAYWEALRILGLPGGPGSNTPRTKAQAALDAERDAADRAAAALKQQEDEDGKSAAVFAQWLTLQPMKGTLVETYLREARRIPLDLLPRLPGAIRFAPRLEHFNKFTGEITEHPAMVTAMTRGSKVVAIHRTYLASDGSGKAAVFDDKGKSIAKMMKGPSRGSAMRLCNGARDLSPNKAAAAGVKYPLIIGEGIETVLTAACDQPDYRAWAAGSLSLMGQLEWPPCASAVVLLGENDASPGAQAAFAWACEHFQAQAAGRPFKAVFPEAGNDWNDWRVAG